jgi:hypothetical protein
VRATDGDETPSGAVTRGLARPDVTGWLHEIAAVVGPQRALLAWSRAASATSLHGMSLTPDQLAAVGERLLEDADDAALRVAVRSCLVRLRVWRTLERTRGGAQ